MISGGGNVFQGFCLSKAVVKAPINDGYPYLLWELSYQPPAITQPTGTVTQVTNAAELHAAIEANENIELMNDIDLDVAPYNEGEGWIAPSDYSGNIFGKGYKLTNLFINATTNERGFLRRTDDASIYDLIIDNAQVTNTGTDTGILIGIAVRGLVQNCKVINSNIVATNLRCGAVFGSINRCIEITYTESINNVINSRAGFVGGHVLGGANVSFCRVIGLTGQLTAGSALPTGGAGGFCGNGNEINFSKCSANINIDSFLNSQFGGFSGRSVGSANECLFTGVIKCGNRTGGFVGTYLGGGINNCYAFGVVEGTGSESGAFVGISTSANISKSYVAANVDFGSATNRGFAGSGNFTYTDCFYDSELSGQTSTAGTATGLTTEQMKDKNNFTNWDFDTIWGID